MAVRTIAKVIRTFDGVEGISAEQKEDIVNYIQRKDILAADQLWKITGHHCCYSYYLVYAVCKRGSLGNTWVLPRAKMMLVPMNFFSSGRICSGGFFVLTEQTCIIFAACFILRGLEKHVDFLRFMFLVGIICPLMQEHFLWPLLKCKLPLCG